MKGRIYKIVCGLSNDVYVGSTIQELKYRFRDHKYDYKQYLKNKKKEVAIYPYFTQYGIENFKIILIKEYDVIDRKHLMIYEALWMYKLKSINKNTAFYFKKLSQKQYRNTHKENRKMYLEINKEKIEKQDRERANKYYNNNKEKILQKIKEKYECIICNITLTKSNKLRHEQTKKHKNNLSIHHS